MSSFIISLSIKYEKSKLLQFPRASSGGFKQAKKKGSFSQMSKKKLNIQISVNIFMLTWEATTINIPLGHYGFRSFKAETESKKAIVGIWKVLAIFLPATIPSVKVTLLRFFHSKFPSTQRCAFNHCDGHLPSTTWFVGTSESLSCVPR